jgi:hypothetical protein
MRILLCGGCSIGGWKHSLFLPRAFHIDRNAIGIVIETPNNVEKAATYFGAKGLVATHSGRHVTRHEVSMSEACVRGSGTAAVSAWKTEREA